MPTSFFENYRQVSLNAHSFVALLCEHVPARHEEHEYIDQDVRVIEASEES